MTTVAANEDLHWLDPGNLYLAVAPDCEVDRPIYQGDVFRDVCLPIMPDIPVEPGKHEIRFNRGMCMAVPHPCQCYRGDSLRKNLTVAPVVEVSNYNNFGSGYKGAVDKFALPDIPIFEETGIRLAKCVADFGQLFTISSNWLSVNNRVACLSHRGLGLLVKRLLKFQLRYPIPLENAVTYITAEWNEAYLMQAWIRQHEGSLEGYTEWSQTPRVLPGINDGEPIAPYKVRAAALDILLAEITGVDVSEPEF